MSLYNRERARRSLVDTLAMRGLSQLATVVAYIIQVRAMSKEDFGVFNLLYAFLPVFSMVASFGLEQVLRRFQPEYLRAGRVDAAVWLVRTVSRGRLLLNIIVLAAILLCWGWVAPLFKLTSFRGVFLIFCLLTVLHFQLQIVQMAMASRMMHRYSVGAVAALSWAKLIFYGGLALHGSFTLTQAVVADTVAYFIVFIFLHFAYRREEKLSTGDYRPDPAERRRLFRYGIFNSFNDAGVLLLYSTLDNFVIAAVIDVTSVGIYAFYSRLNLMTQNLLPQKLFDNVIQPLLFSSPADQADHNLPRYFTFLLNMNLLLQWPVLAFCVVYHADLVQVVWGKFVEDSWLLPMIVGFTTLNVIADPASVIAQYEEKAGVILASKIFAVYNIVAMILMVPAMGIAGAVLASGSAQLMKNGFIWWHVRRRARWLNWSAALLTAVALWGGMVVLALLVRQYVPLPPIAQLAVGLVLIGVTLLIHLRSPALGPSDREMLARVLTGRESGLLRRLGLLQPSSGTGGAA